MGSSLKTPLIFTFPLSVFPVTVVVGPLLGVLESVGAGVVSSTYKDVIAFGILLLALFVRPGVTVEKLYDYLKKANLKKVTLITIADGFGKDEKGWR